MRIIDRSAARSSAARPPIPPMAHRAGAQSMVEAALLMPLILLLLIGIVDLGRLFYFDVTVQNAVREGARRAIDHTRTNSEIQAYVTAAAPGITLTSIGVTPSTRSYTTTGPVTVTATYLFSPWTPGISSAFGTSIAITRTATMMIL